MDPLTHCIIGSVSAKAVHASPRRFWLMTLLGLVPDFDVVFNSFGGWATLLQHRGLSHSFLGVILQAAILAFALKKWDKGPFKERAFHYSLPIALHVFCDYLTSYGVPLLLPFSHSHFSWDLVGSVNLLPLGISALAVLWMHKREKSGLKVTAPVWAMWALYFMLSFSGRSYAMRLAATPNLTMVPSVVNPFSWRAVSLDAKSHSYKHYTVDLLTRKVEYLGHSAQPNGDFPVQMSMSSPLVKDFIKNNRWPIVRTEKVSSGWRVEWGTIIYSVRGMVRGKVVVDVAADGRILNEQSVVSFWDPPLN